MKATQNYPKDTVGTRLAAKGRRLCNRLTDKQREDSFNKAMVIIYGRGQKQTVGAGR
jgi:hypothetical protein